MNKTKINRKLFKIKPTLLWLLPRTLQGHLIMLQTYNLYNAILQRYNCYNDILQHYNRFIHSLNHCYLPLKIMYKH